MFIISGYAEALSTKPIVPNTDYIMITLLLALILLVCVLLYYQRQKIQYKRLALIWRNFPDIITEIDCDGIRRKKRQKNIINNNKYKQQEKRQKLTQKNKRE
jgi:hypothetical protein